ncbi:hypothetical protein CDL15_Pgr026400 [Punica granatum]|uniref:Uncharacterized protein n=1 Tax=Punica granatum TaxID=22663 RepID=A0A218XP10_PUNGR|nr:hypothetical protein CDL15_Pgr026400 [Punica granatum]
MSQLAGVATAYALADWLVLLATLVVLAIDKPQVRLVDMLQPTIVVAAGTSEVAWAEHADALMNQQKGHYALLMPAIIWLDMQVEALAAMSQ